MDIEQNEEIEFSLADIAQLDATDIAEVRFEALPAGVYTFRGTHAYLEDTVNRNDERRLVLHLKMEVTEVKAVTDRNYRTQEQRDELIGRTHSERQYIVPSEAIKGIGIIKSLYWDLGLPNTGNIGGVEGSEPGWIDGFVGHEFTCRIRTSKYNGNPVANIQLDKRPKE